MGWQELSPKMTSQRRSGNRRRDMKSVIESAVAVYKNNLKQSFYFNELFFIYFACPDCFAPHLVVLNISADVQRASA
jgi:hypothetical protein